MDALSQTRYFSLKTRCVCETQMPPIMANSKYGQGHKDNYLDTVGRSCHEKCSCAYLSHNLSNLEVMTKVNFKKNWSNVNVKDLIPT